MVTVFIARVVHQATPQYLIGSCAVNEPPATNGSREFGGESPNYRIVSCADINKMDSKPQVDSEHIEPA
jgi:hypothetical protein